MGMSWVGNGYGQGAMGGYRCRGWVMGWVWVQLSSPMQDSGVYVSKVYRKHVMANEIVGFHGLNLFFTFVLSELTIKICNKVLVGFCENFKGSMKYVRKGSFKKKNCFSFL